MSIVLALLRVKLKKLEFMGLILHCYQCICVYALVSDKSLPKSNKSESCKRK